MGLKPCGAAAEPRNWNSRPDKGGVCLSFCVVSSVISADVSCCLAHISLSPAAFAHMSPGVDVLSHL